METIGIIGIIQGSYRDCREYICVRRHKWKPFSWHSCCWNIVQQQLCNPGSTMSEILHVPGKSGELCGDLDISVYLDPRNKVTPNPKNYMNKQLFYILLELG